VQKATTAPILSPLSPLMSHESGPISLTKITAPKTSESTKKSRDIANPAKSRQDSSKLHCVVIGTNPLRVHLEAPKIRSSTPRTGRTGRLSLRSRACAGRLTAGRTTFPRWGSQSRLLLNRHTDSHPAPTPESCFLALIKRFISIFTRGR